MERSRSLTMKKCVKIATVILTALWIAALAASIITRITYTEPDGEAFGIFMEKAIYNMLIITAVMGVATSALLSLCLHRFWKTVSPDTLKKAALITATADNILFYLSLFLLFGVNKDWVLLPFAVAMIAWVLCFVGSLVLTAVNRHNKNNPRQ